MLDPDKYIVFKRDEFYALMEELFNSGLKDRGAFVKTEILDAVVIRRQDKFASPCLLTYAQMIGMVAEIWPNKRRRAELQSIADYFHEQGVLAGEEGHHFPTL